MSGTNTARAAIRALQAAEELGAAVDPYLYWMLLKVVQRLARKDPPLDVGALRFSVLIEYKKGRVPTPEQVFAAASNEGVWPSHLHSMSVDTVRVRPCTASLEGLLRLIQDLKAGPKSSIARFELCVAPEMLDDVRQAQPNNARPQPGTGEDFADARAERAKAKGHHARYRDFVRSRAASPQPRPRDGSTDRSQAPRCAAPAPLICVVDDLCNFAAGLGTARILGLWHQGNDKNTLERLDGTRHEGTTEFEPAIDIPQSGSREPWRPGASSGALIGRKLQQTALQDQREELLAYRLARYSYPTPRFSHASVVLGLIRGTRQQRRSRQPGDCADQPEILFVQLPVPTVIDTSASSLSAHALDGIHHALEAAQPGQTVIVNLSYGSHSGPHDGTSIWDAGLLELLDLYNGKSVESRGKTLHVVLPAGNSHRSRSHAHLHVSSSRPFRTLRWKVQPDDPTANFVELWFPQGVDAIVELTPPGGDEKRTIRVHRGQWSPDKPRVHRGQRSPDKLPAGGFVVYPRAVAQSPVGSMALVCVGSSASYEQYVELFDRPKSSAQFPKELLDSAAKFMKVEADESRLHAPKMIPDDLEGPTPAEHGVWTIRVSADPMADIQDFQFHAWVMRGDAAPGRRQVRQGNAGRQSYFLDCDGETIDPSFTMNGIACLEHERLWVVGAMRHSDKTISPYSAAGPNRANGSASQEFWRCLGPDVVVAGDESLSQPGLLTTGMMSGSQMRVGGTSIAAAAFTRKLFDHLAAGQPAATVALPEPDGPSRVSPTGNPYIEDAPFVLRGECNRRIGGKRADAENDCCPTSVPAAPAGAASGPPRSR